MKIIKKCIPVCNKRNIVLLFIIGLLLPVIELISIKCLSLNYLKELKDLNLWGFFLLLFISRFIFIFLQQVLASQDRANHLKNYQIALCEVYLNKNQKIGQKKILDLLYHRSSMAADTIESFSYLIGPLCSILIYLLSLIYLYGINIGKVAIICLPFLTLAYLYKKYSTKNFAEINYYFSQLYKIVHFKFQIIANNIKTFFIQDLRKSSIAYTHTELSRTINRSKIQLFFGILFSVNLVVINVFSIANLNISIGKMVLINIVLLRIVSALSEFSGHLKKIQTHFIHFLKSVIFLNLSMSNDNHEMETQKISTLEFGPIAIGYKTPILKVPYQKWQIGQIILLKGCSGKGKSTLLKTLMGLLEPMQGNPLPTGLDLSYADQVPLIITNDINANIVLNKTEVSEENIERVKCLACIDFKNANDYSLGQLQRINIARTLISDKSIIIWDEATSNIDIETEIKIANNIKKFNKNTIFIISTHRNSYDLVADLKINLDDKIYDI